MAKPDPKDVHDFDQALASVALLAAAVARYFTALVAEGVPEAHAVVLTQMYQLLTMRPGYLSGGDQPPAPGEV